MYKLSSDRSIPADKLANIKESFDESDIPYEITWKLMQTIVNENIKEVYGPKGVIREAANRLKIYPFCRKTDNKSERIFKIIRNRSKKQLPHKEDPNIIDCFYNLSDQ